MKFGIDSDGNYGYIKAGADTVTPFNISNYDVKASAVGYQGSSSRATISITVPDGVKKGVLVCASTGWGTSPAQDTPTGNGIKTLSSKYRKNTNSSASCLMSIYECEFNESQTISLTFGDNGGRTNYSTAHMVLLA